MEARSIDDALSEATEALIAAKHELTALGDDAPGSEVEKRLTDVRTQRDRLVEQWLQIRKDEGLKIDPATAEVCWTYAQTLDPYGIDPELPEECRIVGREYFARSPGGDIWVEFGDLAKEIQEALQGHPNAKPSFSVGADGVLKWNIDDASDEEIEQWRESLPSSLTSLSDG
jgi:hypothetical protein